MIIGRYVSMRPVEPADLPFLREIANNRLVASSVVGWDLPVSDRGQEVWWESAVRDRGTLRLIVQDEDGQCIGMTGLWDIDWHNRSALTAIKLHPDRVTRRGLATDSIKTIMAYAFYDVGLHRLWGRILPFNGSSFGAYVKNCGWRIEGVLREEVLRGDSYLDLYAVGVLKPEFDALPDSQEYIDRILPADIGNVVATPEEWWAKPPGSADSLPRAPRGD